MKAAILAWLRQSSTIMGIAVLLSTTVALASRQIEIKQADPLYVGALFAIFAQQEKPKS